MSKFDQKLTRKNLFKYSEKNLPFLKLDELKTKLGAGPFIIKGMWIASPKNNRFDVHPVLVIQGYNVDLPPHTLADVEDMLQDPETIDQINNGECGFKISSYTNNFGTFLTVDWIKLCRGV